MSNLFSVFLNKYLPTQCLLCAGIIHSPPQPGANSICPACQAQLPYWQASESCPQCGRPDCDGYVCGQCLAKPPAFDQTLAIFLFQEPIKSLIHAGKFARQWGIFNSLTEQFASTLPPITADCIVPLPLHPRRLGERGFNQALEIAQWLAPQLAIPLRPQLLRRVRDTEHQARLSAQARWKNLRSAFACQAHCAGKTIIVVDDVMTSGASLQAAAKALKQAGASTVINIVLARTRSQR